MSKLKAFLGYFMSALMVPMVLVTLLGMQPIAEWLINTTGVVITPWSTGGEVVRTLPHGAYETRIHRPVIDAPIGQKPEGFVQVVWAKSDSLPEPLIEDIDYNHDGQADSQVTLHSTSKSAEWRPYNARALRLDGPYQIGDGLGVRVWMKR